jgi:protein TonB
MLGAWRYAMPDSARTRFIVAALLSVGFHVAVFFGVGRHQPVVRAVVEDRPVVQMVIPIMKELEEPEPVMTDEPPPVDKASYAPSLMDIPNRIALPTDFVQQIDFASLIPPPDMEGAKVFVIPSNIARGAVATGIGNIFSLAELDRIPEPIVQPAPLFPPTLKREVESAKVTVEFIVDRDGKVLNPVVVQSTHEGFNEAAVVGVSRWRFRPGMKGGKKVNTRMSVPILFRIVTDEP